MMGWLDLGTTRQITLYSTNSGATINYQPSTINYQPTTINHQLSTINQQLTPKQMFPNIP